MPHEELKTLYHTLCETRFSFVPPGEHHIHDVYSFVRNTYSEFCDDAYLCSDNCKSGHNRPEWQHRVRAALDYLNRNSKGVRPADQTRVWYFEPSISTSPSQFIGSDIEAPSPSRVETTTFRVLRDTSLARRIKSLNGHKCQVCDLAIELPDGSHYAEAHHIQPLGTPHDGPDVAGNIVVLCPNHHAMCDYGIIRLDPQILQTHSGHVIDATFVDYHNTVIYVPQCPDNRAVR